MRTKIGLPHGFASVVLEHRKSLPAVESGRVPLTSRHNNTAAERAIVLSRQLINYFDMIIKLGGHEVAYAYGYLANAFGLSTNEPVDSLIGTDRMKLFDALNEVEKVCGIGRLDLPTTADYLPIVRSALSTAKTYKDVQYQIGQLRDRMHSELKQRLFLFVPPIEARFYNQKEAFGSEVATRFRRVADDIESAGDGISLGMYTASVFHLMRVMEYLVQELGAYLGVPGVSDLTWQKILDGMNKAIKLLPEETFLEKEHKEKLAAASANLFNIKLAWRNTTMHPKATYKPEEAAEIYDCVKRFALHLAMAI